MVRFGEYILRTLDELIGERRRLYVMTAWLFMEQAS